MKGDAEIIGNEEEMKEPDNGITNAHLFIYPKGNSIVVDSSYATTLSLHNVNGTLLRILDVRPGINTYSGMQPGIYIIGKKKVYVK